MRAALLLVFVFVMLCAVTDIARAADDAGAGDLTALMARADAVAGQKTARVCTVCHSVKKGEPAILGPNLYGIYGRPHGDVAGYHYSDALKATHNKTWDAASLNGYLYNPRADIPGTKMTYPGMANDNDRANVIAWLRTLADQPVPTMSSVKSK